MSKPVVLPHEDKNEFDDLIATPVSDFSQAVRLRSTLWKNWPAPCGVSGGSHISCGMRINAI